LGAHDDVSLPFKGKSEVWDSVCVCVTKALFYNFVFLISFYFIEENQQQFL
jgi:hypothetical protein